MPINPETTVLVADVMTLLWEGQLATAASIEELGLWIKAQGGSDAHAQAMDALEALDRNANAIAAGIMALRS